MTYRDTSTGAILHDGNLERRYLDYVEMVTKRHGGAVEYDEWLENEIGDGRIAESVSPALEAIRNWDRAVESIAFDPDTAIVAGNEPSPLGLDVSRARDGGLPMSKHEKLPEESSLGTMDDRTAMAYMNRVAHYRVIGMPRHRKPREGGR